MSYSGIGFIPSIEGWDRELERGQGAGDEAIYYKKGSYGKERVSPAEIKKLKSEAIGRSLQQHDSKEYGNRLAAGKKATELRKSLQTGADNLLRKLTIAPPKGFSRMDRAHLQLNKANLKPNKHMLNNDKYKDLINEKGLFKNRYTQELAFKQYDTQRDVKGIPEFNIPAQGGTLEQHQQAGTQPRTWQNPYTQEQADEVTDARNRQNFIEENTRNEGSTSSDNKIDTPSTSETKLTELETLTKQYKSKPSLIQRKLIEGGWKPEELAQKTIDHRGWRKSHGRTGGLQGVDKQGDLTQQIDTDINRSLGSNGNQTMKALSNYDWKGNTGLDLANKLNIGMTTKGTQSAVQPNLAEKLGIFNNKELFTNDKMKGMWQNMGQNQGKAAGGLQGGFKGAGQVAQAVGAVANALDMLTGGQDKIQYAANQSPTGGKSGPAPTGVAGGQDDLNWWQFGNF